THAFIKKYGVEVFAQSFVEPLFLLKNREHLKEEIAELKNIAKHSSEKGVLATTIAMRDRPDRTKVLASLTCPVLLIGGKNDATIPYEKLEEQKALSSFIMLEGIDNCGHMGMYEQRDHTRKVLTTFLKNAYN
ncbi:MAG: alpha/beta hydrolase, partial [Cytophagales bacterium]|nr:alpha/beta hydrolase [Cytophaga sp.]